MRHSKQCAKHLLPLTLAGLVFMSWAMLPKQSSSRPAATPSKFSNPRLQAVSDIAEADEATQARVSEAYGKLPLSFEANRGQADSRVKFLSRGSAYTLSLTSNEAILTLRKAGRARRNKKAAALPAELNDPRPATGDTESSVLRMKLEGANPSPRVSGLEELPGKSNYFIGNDPQQWQTNVSQYAKVEYRNVYPGVDVVYYGNGRQLEYDFIVSPGADPNVIKLSFTGASDAHIDERGDLVLRVAGGEIRQHRPVTYQEAAGVRQEVPSRYVMKEKGQVGIEVGSYDGSRPLVIDPVLVYSTYLGVSSPSDQRRGIFVDAVGNAYIICNSFSPYGNHHDVFVAKLNPSGSALVYSTYFGGTLTEFGYDIAVDAAGNAHLTGFTTSPDLPLVNALQGSYGGGQMDCFVAKLDATGSTLVYSTYLGGSDFEGASGIAVDASGNTYLVGGVYAPDRLSSNTFPVANALQSSHGGSYSDAFVTKLNASGSALIYSTYLGGSADDWGEAIAVDSLGNAYVTGETSSTNFPLANPLQDSHGGSNDTFVTKIDAAGSALVYSTYLGSSGSRGNAIALDAVGNVYVAGYTSSTNFPTVNALQDSYGGDGDAFVTKLNSTGSAIVYATYLGGSFYDAAFGVAVDTKGNVHIAGSTESPDFPTTNALQTARLGNFDGFVTKLNADGSAFVYSTYLGGSSFDQVLAIAVDAADNAYLMGETSSADFPVTPDAFRTVGSRDNFVTKISVETAAQAFESLSDIFQTLNLASGISNSLDAKLQNALDALNSARGGSTEAAIKQLLAFINSVNAQRGKAISEADADALIAAANRVIEALRTP